MAQLRECCEECGHESFKILYRIRSYTDRTIMGIRYQCETCEHMMDYIPVGGKLWRADEIAEQLKHDSV